jgi:NADH:ubiquinone oxidoreductase subunit 5 (subunit L)/multisubunit Na+/H+ antiporter MnhA subunit
MDRQAMRQYFKGTVSRNFYIFGLKNEISRFLTGAVTKVFYSIVYLMQNDLKCSLVPLNHLL